MEQFDLSQYSEGLEQYFASLNGLRYAVLRDGILLFCRDRQAMIEFRVRALNEYLDFKPILKRHERAILEKARKGELFKR
jgi:hypothetical protein